MPRTVPAAQRVDAVGAVLAMTEPDALGDVVDVGDTVLVVTNGSGAPVNVTAQTPGTFDGLAIAENVLAVADGETAAVALPKRLYGRPAGGADPGRAYIDYSAVAGVTRAVITRVV